LEKDEGFRQAFATVERYEKYKLVRTTGILILVIGIGRFLLSWILDQTFLISLNFNYETGANIVFFFRLVVQIILIITLILILIFSYISIKKTSINQGGEIIGIRDIQFLVMICILIYLTFFLRIIASIYFEEVLGIFICYFIFKRGIKIDLKELLHLGIVLFAISVIEVLGRVLIIVFLFNHQLFIPIWTTFYIGVAIMFMVPYLITGRRIFKNASFNLEEI
jgi:hypothetical protein